LFDGTALLAPIAVEAQAAYSAANVWTGAATPTALATSTSNCANWTDASTGFGACGLAGTTTSLFFDSGTSIVCSYPVQTLCLQE
jgi:hypothetical protein